MSQILANPTMTVDFATWEAYLRHTRIQFMLAGTPEFEQYASMKAAGVAPMLLSDLYSYDPHVPIDRMTSMVKTYGTDVRFIQLLEKTMHSIYGDPRTLNGLWRWDATPYQTAVLEPSRRLDLHGSTFGLVRGLAALYRNTDMRKRHINDAAVHSGEEYGRFALNLTAVEELAKLAADRQPEQRNLDHMRSGIDTFLRRVHKACVYRGAA